jgi:hypothetical protein
LYAASTTPAALLAPRLLIRAAAWLQRPGPAVSKRLCTTTLDTLDIPGPGTCYCIYQTMGANMGGRVFASMCIMVRPWQRALLMQRRHKGPWHGVPVGDWGDSPLSSGRLHHLPAAVCLSLLARLHVAGRAWHAPLMVFGRRDWFPSRDDSRVGLVRGRHGICEAIHLQPAPSGISRWTGCAGCRWGLCLRAW